MKIVLFTIEFSLADNPYTIQYLFTLGKIFTAPSDTNVDYVTE